MEFVSEGCRELVGLAPEEFTAGRVTYDSLIHPEEREAVWKNVQTAIQAKAPFQLEYRLRHADGSWRWVLDRGRGVWDEQGELLVLEGFASDITKRRQNEAEIEKLALVARETDNAVILADVAGCIEWVNAGFTRLTGYTLDEIKGRKPGSFLQGKDTNPETARLMRERLVAGDGFEVEIVNYSKAGRAYWVEVSVQPLHEQTGKLKGFFSVNADITERKEAQRQLLRAQRLESIGTLAGGVAHDLNNALAPILMGIELLRMENPDSTEMLDTMEASARRGAGMVRQVVTFAKGAEGERLLVQPRHLLGEMEKIIRGTFPKNIEFRTAYGKKLSAILGDTTQLHQVLLNLCVNARDAMPNGGTLTLEAENVEIDATHASAVPEAKPGRYVAWRVKDRGTGIPPEIVERIFEPFFSTKGPDKGTGLGLSTVIGIVKSHGGFLQVHSTPGQGSTFSIYLPADPSGTGDTTSVTKAETAFRGKGETILVVDDEANMRDVSRSVLTALNFKVLTAADGTAALIQVAEKRAELRVVITDLHMPHMDGLTFVRVLKHMLPEAGIIVTSGRFDEREVNEFKALGVRALLDKPFNQQKLVETLKSVFTEKV
jgi:PAS domain S-box-containing protein